MRPLFVILIIYLHWADNTWFAEASEPYCIYNKTEYIYVKVNKTREVKINKPWYKKLSKPATKLEYYEGEEMVPKITTVKGCCDGYEMSELRLCEPKCIEGCPENSKCVEPEVCKCKSGYFSSLSPHDGKHYCQPICEKECPEHSVCVGPNECACRTGYRVSKGATCEPFCITGCSGNGECIAPNQCKCHDGFRADKGSCVPLCILGDGCKNGICVDKEECQCNFGFVLNLKTRRCEPNLSIFKESDWQVTTEVAEESTGNTETENVFESETDIDTPEDDINPSEVFEELFESTTNSWQSYSTDAGHKCPVDFVLYRGRCQPLKFAIDEIDCRLQPCTHPRAICTDNGTCACSEGYKLFKKYLPIETTESTVSPESTKKLVQSLCLTPEELKDLELNDTLDEETLQGHQSLSAAPIFFIILGAVIMLSALVYLGMRLVSRQRGQLNVEGKQLSCAYDNRVCGDREKSEI